jgi:uncharacterized protein
MMSMLLEAGAHTDIRDYKTGATALIWAAYKSDFKAASILISHNADVNIAERSNMSALLWASFRGNYDLLKLLMSKGANPGLKSAKR